MSEPRETSTDRPERTPATSDDEGTRETRTYGKQKTTQHDTGLSFEAEPEGVEEYAPSAGADVDRAGRTEGARRPGVPDPADQLSSRSAFSPSRGDMILVLVGVLIVAGIVYLLLT